MRIRIIPFVVLALLVFTSPAFAEMVRVKAQGSDDYTLYASSSNHEAATVDAKRKALEKYIGGLKSQNEANRLLSAKQKLFENIDEYVKDVAEIAKEEKNGRVYVTIQASIDRLSLNKFLQDTFKSDSKKSGVRRKTVAFIFAAREADVVERVEDHRVDQSVDRGRDQLTESLDTSGKGESFRAATDRGKYESEQADNVAERKTADITRGLEVSASYSGQENRVSSEKGRETADISVRGDMDKKERLLKTDAEDGQTENTAFSGRANAAGTRSGSQNTDSELMQSGSFDGRQSVSASGQTDESRNFRQEKSGRHDTASEQTSSWADKASKTSDSIRESDSRKYAEKKSTEFLHSEKVTFRVSEYGTVNAQLTEMFREQGMRVSESLDAAEILEQLAKANSVNQIRPADIRRTIAAAKEEGIDFLLIGTLDVGVERKDPATGNIAREVLINANVYDLQGRGIEKAAAVGNLNFSGLGATPDIAKNNALSTAVRSASGKLIAQTREYILESEDE